MFSLKNMKIKLALLFLVGISFYAVDAIYVPNSRETSVPPEEVIYAISVPEMDGLVEIYSIGDLTYYYRESRDTIVIQDDRNGYTWKTGTDLEFNKDIKDECDDVLDLYEEQFLDLDVTTFNGLASVNALLEDVEVVGHNGVIKVVTTGLDDTYLPEDVTFTLSDIDLENTKSYQISFDAQSFVDRSAQVVLGTVLDETISLTSTMTTYTFTVDMTQELLDQDLVFLFGHIDGDSNDEGTMYLDNVKVEEFDGSEVIDETNQVARGDFDLLPEEYTVVDADLLAACRDQEVKLNTTYTGFANSLLTIEYFDSANTIKRISSASRINVESRLEETSLENEFILDINFKNPDIDIRMHITLDEQGIRYQVKDEDIKGDDQHSLAAILISPFLGASGGAYESFDLEEMDYGDEIFKYKIPGYSLVPDGAGTLIRFGDNTEKLNEYEANIYGTNIAQTELFYGFEGSYVPFKTASLPVFGMSHGDDTQAAFVAFATKGDEYMQVVSMPEENLTYYNFTYPRFEFNRVYLQVYNKQGWGYLTTYNERNHFDIDMRYNFLAGDGSTGPQASYVGMAESYADYLMSDGVEVLSEKSYAYDDIPIRLDFIMSDVEAGIAGYVNQVTTTVDGVDRVLQDVRERNIENVNVGLMGWQDGGITLGDPWKTDFTRQIGTKREFTSLIDKYAQEGIDISFSQNYYNINEEQMGLRTNAVQHTSTWYSRRTSNTTPIEEFYFARPVKSVEWMLEQTEKLNDLNVLSYTITGITSNLTSDYTNEDVFRREAMEMVQAGFGDLTSGKMVNAEAPNAYLYQYVDRYLQAPVYGTQFLIETDTVPFVELVLQNTMELYGPYSNFSFYTDSDILRMVDYNIYPSFVLTEEPAYLLTDTMSRDYYSTEYHLYADLIEHVYTEVNGALGTVIGANWVNRTVVENGVIVNEYDNGVIIVINYTDEAINYEGNSVQAVSYSVIGGN